MADYELTKETEEDLIEIWAYSAETWGHEQADRYLSQILACCDAVAASPTLGRAMDGLPPVQLYRCEQHFVFYTAAATVLTVIAVLHKRMDLPRQLLNRLEAM